MHYQIKRGTLTVLDERPTGTLVKKIMGENVVNMTFSLVNYVQFELGDTVEVFGETHYLNRSPIVKKSSRKFEYTLIFETIAYDLGKVNYLFYGDDNTFKEPDFSLHATAENFLKLLVQNANRVQSGWQMGMVDQTEAKTLTFTKENCLQVLSRVAIEFNTEFWIDGKTIHLTKRGPISEMSFEYGKGKQLYEVQRAPKDGTNVLTRLYAYGSTRNLLREYRNYSNRLLLPLANSPYIEKNVAKYGVCEKAEIWDDIFPRRESTVTYTANMLSFTDSSMDFDLNDYLLPGETAKVTFNSGQLAGYTFEIVSYNHSTKTFTFKKNEEEKALEIPNEYLKPAFGDKYVLIDIFMPQSYVDAAEKELLARATEYLNQNSVPRVMYSVQCTEIDFMKQGIYVGLGIWVRVIDADLGVNALMRVVGLTRDISKKYQYTLELSESFTIPQILRQYAQQDKINKYIAAQDKPKTSDTFVPKWYPLWLGPGYSTDDKNHAYINRAEYMKDPHNHVWFRGSVYYNGSGTYTSFTLPTGHRPYKRHFTSPYMIAGEQTNLIFHSNGSVRTRGGNEGFAFMLDGISYVAEEAAEIVTEPEEPKAPEPVLTIMNFEEVDNGTSIMVTWRMKSDILPAADVLVSLEEFDGVARTLSVTFPANATDGSGFYYSEFTGTYAKDIISRTVDMTLLNGSGYIVGTDKTAVAFIPQA